MKKFLFAIFLAAVVLSSAIIPISAAVRINGDSSGNSVFPTETNISDGTDTSILDSMMPDSMGTNVPDSAVDSSSAPDSTSALENAGDSDGTSALIGVIIAIIAVAGVIVLVIALMPKKKNKK